MFKPLECCVGLLSRLGRRPRSPYPAKRNRQRPLRFEPLEQRQLLSGQTVWFSTVTDASEPSSPGSIVVMRDSTEGDLSVEYTYSGSATAGSDYECLSGSVTIPHGSTSATITVMPIDDSEIEGDETVELTLTYASSSSTSYNIGGASSATVTIADDDVAATPTVSVWASDEYASEAGPDSGQFVVARDTTDGSLIVFYTIGGSATAGSDYQGVSGSVTIPHGSTSATITIMPIDDSEIEGDETVEVTLSSCSNYAMGDPTSATVTIADDDVERATVTRASMLFTATTPTIVPSSEPQKEYPRIQKIAGFGFRDENGTLQCTAYPTDNYIVIAGRQSAVKSADFRPDGKTPCWNVRPQHTDDVPDGTQTKTLSVVRTLHVEVDRMGTPDLTQGPRPSVIASGNVLYHSGNTIRISNTLDAAEDHRFRGGKITLKQGSTVLGTYDVVDNDRITVNNTTFVQITISQPVPAGADSFVDLYDDDALTDAAAMTPDLSLLQTFLAPAFIKVNLTRSDLAFENNQSVNQDDVTFNLNVGADPSSLITEVRAITGYVDDQGLYHSGTRQSQVDPRFWCAYICGAYQADLDSDGDHVGLFGTIYVPGVTVNIKDRTRLPSGGQLVRTEAEVSFVFAETARDWAAHAQGQVRDFADVWKLVCVHEVLHQLGLIDVGPHGRIMAAGDILDANVSVDQLAISADGLRRLRDVLWPGWRELAS